MEPTDFRPPKLRHSTSVMPATWSSGSSHVTQPFDVGTSFSFPVPVPRGPIGSRGISPLHAPSRMVTRPPLQQVPSGPHSIPVAPHYTLPSHPPPTTPEPAKVQNSSPSATPEKARTRVRTLRASHDKLTPELAGGSGGGNTPFYWDYTSSHSAISSSANHTRPGEAPEPLAVCNAGKGKNSINGAYRVPFSPLRTST